MAGDSAEGSRRLTLSHSQVASYRACPAQWGYRYAERLRPITDAPALVRGRVFHAGLAAGYQRWSTGSSIAVLNAAFDAAGAEWRAYLDQAGGSVPEGSSAADVYALDRSMIEQHFAATESDLDGMTPVLVEERFEVPVLDAGGRAHGLYLTGYFDLVGWDWRYGELVVYEHKSTAASVIGGIGSRLELDPQTAAYVYALRHLLRSGALDARLKAIGASVGSKTIEQLTGHVVVNVSRRKVPSVPRVLKDGTVSVAACDTTAELWQVALDEQQARYERREAPAWLWAARAAVDAKPTEAAERKLEAAVERWEEVRRRQRERADELAASNAFFHRYEYRRSDAEIERWRSEFWVDAARIRIAERDPRQRTRNVAHCATLSCAFHDVCYRPDDEGIRRAQFRVSEPRAEPEAPDEEPTLDLGF